MDSRTRIGLYCDSDVIGGAERSMLTLAAAYRGPAQLVIVSPSATVLEAAAFLGSGTQRRLLDIPAGPARSFIGHRRQLEALGLDLLQVTLPNPFAARPAQLAAMSLRLPTIAVQQHVMPPRRRRGSWLVRALAHPLASTVAVGEQTARDLRRFYDLRADRLAVIHNGVGAESTEPDHLDRRPVVGCVARYEEQKGLDRLLRAMVDIPDARLLLVGDGSLRDDLVREAASLGIADRVDVGGWREDARSAIAAFDVFALASRDEAFPLTIVEAMLERTPVVATDVGSVAEAVRHGETGLLVASGDHAQLVAAIRRLLDDGDLRDRLAKAAHELATERFSAERMAEDYAALWETVLGTRVP